MEIKRRINGTSWKIKIVTPKQMKKIQGKGAIPAGGLCVPSEKTIYLDKECVNYTTVCHELVHAYWSDLHLDDTNNIQLSDLEEIVASLISEKGDKIVKQAKRITNDLLKLKGS